MTATRLAVLHPGDEAALDAFLSPRAESSMFLRSNARRAGLVDCGQTFEMTYVAAWQGDDIVSVAAHGWNGLILLQAPDAAILPSLVRAAVDASGRAVTGFSGPHAQVIAARAALGLENARASMDSREDLFSLALADLILPAPLAAGRWICRAPIAEERALLADWRADYHVESLGLAPGRELERVRSGFTIDAVQRVLVVDGRPVAFSTFNAQLPDVVQVGGVFTPPELRRRGYARAVVGGALRDAFAAGVSRAILFTGDDNLAARTAYLALGFVIVGDYGLVLLA